MANLDTLFHSMLNADEKFRNTFVAKIDQEISKLEGDLETAREARSVLSQGQIQGPVHPVKRQAGGAKRGRPKGSRNKAQGQQAQLARTENENTHRYAVMDIIRKRPGITSAELKESLLKGGHKIDEKVLYATIYNSMNKYHEIRKEGKPRSQKYFVTS